ncbi:uncharacterized protein [Rutidosis leptorrhynchoides]|uniref:uncharacterized protein n=1 Tax=Rutidosis leptorrhynchoides TaxID=125765 RepID=UPI003A99FECA
MSSDAADNGKSSDNIGKSFAIAYLINSCGLSPQSAQSATKHVNFKSSRKPDSAIVSLQKNGFSKTQITTLIRKYPRVLMCKSDKTLLPKLEFLRSKGFTDDKLTKTVTGWPRIFRYSLEKQIIPTFEFFVEFLKSKEKACLVIQRYACVLSLDIEKKVLPKINTLRENGVPESNVAFLLGIQPRLFEIGLDRLEEAVQEVKKLGFNPLQLSFLSAVGAFIKMRKSTWERKFKVYESWGWSESQVLEAFRKNPRCLMASDDKIMSSMDIIVNKLRMGSGIAELPRIITYSLKNRVIPRVSVAQALVSKGFINDINLLTLVKITEKAFLERFVLCHKKEAPNLLKLYRKKLDQPQ